MSAKVLQLVNSAYFGNTQRIASIQQAVMYLGIELLKGLALSGNVFGTIGKAGIEGFSLETLQMRSLRTACLAKRFVADPRRAEEAFTAALVADIGQIIIATGLRKGYQDVLRQARDGRRPLHAVELETLGVTHAEIGAHLLGVWGLPFSIIEGVAYHHRPNALGDGPCEMLGALHAADALVDPPQEGVEAELDLDFFERAGLVGRLVEWRRIAASAREAA
jgi:HD-like signal output (HDOD) protein